VKLSLCNKISVGGWPLDGNADRRTGYIDMEGDKFTGVLLLSPK